MSHLVDDLTAALPGHARGALRLSQGELLFRQGDRPVSLFLLTSGRVDLMRWTASGTAVRLHSAGPGETLAEASLFAETYHCDGVVREDASVTRFAIDAVRRVCITSPALAFALVRHLSASLRDARRLVELRAIHPLPDRLLARLSELAGSDGQLPETLILKDVAREIGATPEATYRALGALTRDGRLCRIARGRFRMPGFGGC